MDVGISLIAESDKPVLRNLLDLYLYDLSVFTEIEMNSHGLFEYRRLDQYWLDESCHPLFIRADDRIAGFVLVHKYGLLGDNRNVIAEFFVLNKYRKQGVGKRAAALAFGMFPGQWEVSQLPRNQPAQQFWRNVVSELTNCNYKETLLNGRPVQYFDFPVNGG